MATGHGRQSKEVESVMSFPLDSLSVTFPVLQFQLGECPGTVSLVFHHPHFFSHTGNGVGILGPLKIKTTSLVLVIFQRSTNSLYSLCCPLSPVHYPWTPQLQTLQISAKDRPWKSELYRVKRKRENTVPYGAPVLLAIHWHTFPQPHKLVCLSVSQ